jgi:hypothetical protein
MPTNLSCRHPYIYLRNLYIQERTIELRILLPNIKTNSSGRIMSWPNQFIFLDLIRALFGVSRPLLELYLSYQSEFKGYVLQKYYSFFSLFLSQNVSTKRNCQTKEIVYFSLDLFYMYFFFINERFRFRSCLYKRMPSDLIDKGQRK